jgi:predicted nuclease with TOPRIM domain
MAETNIEWFARIIEQAKRAAALEIENAELKAKNKDRRNEIYQLKKRYENTASLMNSSNQLLRLKTLTADNDLMREALTKIATPYKDSDIPVLSLFQMRTVAKSALSEVEVNQS